MYLLSDSIQLTRTVQSSVVRFMSHLVYIGYIGIERVLLNPTALSVLMLLPDHQSLQVDKIRIAAFYIHGLNATIETRRRTYVPCNSGAGTTATGMGPTILKTQRPKRDMSTLCVLRTSDTRSAHPLPLRLYSRSLSVYHPGVLKPFSNLQYRED